MLQGWFGHMGLGVGCESDGSGEIRERDTVNECMRIPWNAYSYVHFMMAQ